MIRQRTLLFPIGSAACALTLGLNPLPTHASAFALIEQSASGLGTSFAGSAVTSNDASVQFFNPAGLIQGVPNFYLSFPASRSLAFGIGVNAPFGLKTQYDDPWIGNTRAGHGRCATVSRGIRAR